MKSKPFFTMTGDVYFSEGALIFVNRATEDFAVPLHNHDFVEFAYIAEGTGFHHIADEVHPVRKGQLTCIPIGVPHVFRPSSADSAKHPLTVYNCVISPRLLERLSGFASDSRLKDFMASLTGEDSRYFFLNDANDTIEKLILSMHREYSMQREASADVLDSLLLQLLVAVMRRRSRLQHPSPSSAAGERKFSEFDLLLAYIDRHLAEDLTLRRLSDVSLWSERHLQRLFRGRTEQSFNRYLQAVRIQKSCELLRDTSHKIGTVAEMVGYRDVPSFLAVFKRITGVTPSAYRKASS